jgi:hypothetical protein
MATDTTKKLPLQVEKDIAVWCRNNYDETESGYGTWFKPAEFGYLLSQSHPVSSSVEDAAKIERGSGQESHLEWKNEKASLLAQLVELIEENKKLKPTKTESTPAPMPEQDESYPGSQYQRLFNWLRDKNFIALQSEMQEVIDIVKKDF